MYTHFMKGKKLYLNCNTQFSMYTHFFGTSGIFKNCTYSYYVFICLSTKYFQFKEYV